MPRSIPGLTISRHRPAAPVSGPEKKHILGSGFEDKVSGAIREKAYEELREKIALGKKAQKRELYGQTVTRFSVNLQSVPGKWQQYGMNLRIYSVHELRHAMKECAKNGRASRALAQRLGIPTEMLHSCWMSRQLPATGPFRFEQMILLVKSARLKWLAGERNTAMACLHAALKERKLSIDRMRRFLSWELIPGIPGFPIYADPEVQLRCEKYAREWPKLRTGAPIFS